MKMNLFKDKIEALGSVGGMMINCMKGGMDELSSNFS